MLIEKQFDVAIMMDIDNCSDIHHLLGDVYHNIVPSWDMRELLYNSPAVLAPETSYGAPKYTFEVMSR